MRDDNPCRATPEELDAIDEALAGDAIPEAELPDYYRAEAARRRRAAPVLSPQWPC